MGHCFEHASSQPASRLPLVKFLKHPKAIDSDPEGARKEAKLSSAIFLAACFADRVFLLLLQHVQVLIRNPKPLLGSTISECYHS